MNDIQNIATYNSVTFLRVESGEHSLRLTDGGIHLNTIALVGTAGGHLILDSKETVCLPPYTVLLQGREPSNTLAIPDGGSAVILSFDSIARCCDSKVSKIIAQKADKDLPSFSFLPMNDGLKGYFMSIDSSLFVLFSDYVFREFKFKEFFYILCQWLDINDFADFLSPAISIVDMEFRNKVLDNVGKSYRVKTLADDCGYSELEFKDKFCKEFGTMPGKWIIEQEKYAVIKRLSDPQMSFKDIAEEMNMSSVQSFSRFCKTYFSKTPSEIRNELQEAAFAS